MSKRIVIAVLSAFSGLAGCAHMQQFDQADAAIAAAKTEVAAANKAGNVWRDTDKLLADAVKARENYRAEEAVKLAKQALDEAKLAVAQAASQTDAKPSFNGQ